MSKIEKEISKYLVVGILAVSTDFSVYFLLLDFLNYSFSKGISFVCGCIVAYVLNKYWTFSLKDRSIIEMFKFAMLYTTTLGANVVVNKISLMLFPRLVLFAFLAATGTSTVLNFIGQKWWVFKKVSC